MFCCVDFHFCHFDFAAAGAKYRDVHVCVFICLPAYLLTGHVQSSSSFLYMLPTAVAWSSSGSIAIHYVLELPACVMCSQAAWPRFWAWLGRRPWLKQQAVSLSV